MQQVYGRTKSVEWNKRDDLMVYFLAKMGHILEEDLKLLTKVGSLGIGDKRLKKHTQAKFITCKKISFNGTMKSVYSLTSTGQRYAKGIGLSIYKSHLKHDVAHSSFITANYSRDDILFNYKSEKELEPANTRLGESRVDGAFYREDGIELVETISKSYSDDKRKAKLKYVANHNHVKFTKYHSRY